MASIGHVALGMAAARSYSDHADSTAKRLTLMAAWSALSLLPDADVIGFHYGIRYGAAFGHRGATHSFVFCFGLAALLAAAAIPFGAKFWRLIVYLSVVLVSHPLLDTLTDGGLGCALYWPFELRRHFAPWRPIPVAPIGAAFFSERGLRVALVELLQFLPLFAYALWPRRANLDPQGTRRARSNTSA
jgi:inner membrane protein